MRRRIPDGRGVQSSYECVKRIEEAEASPKNNQAEKFKERRNEEYRNGNFMAALDYYTQAIVCNPNNAVYLLNGAAVYSKLGMVDEAIKDCKNGLKIDDRFVKLRFSVQRTKLDQSVVSKL